MIHDNVQREIDAYWSKQADLAYEERKKHVIEVFNSEGWKPWMQYQVNPSDLPWRTK